MSDNETWPLPAATQLDESLPTPLYHQIYLVLREQIRSGAIPPDAMLPGEQHLARMFNVSRITVKRALNELAADGLLHRHRGRGTIVTSAPAIPVVKGSFDNLLESLHIMGLETQIEVIDVANIQADATTAKFLEIETGAPVQRAVRRRMLQGEPFSHLVTYIPGDIAEHFSMKDLATTSDHVPADPSGTRGRCGVRCRAMDHGGRRRAVGRGGPWSFGRRASVEGRACDARRPGSARAADPFALSFGQVPVPRQNSSQEAGGRRLKQRRKFADHPCNVTHIK